MTAPTFSQTYAHLMRVCDAAHRGMQRLGWIEGQDHLRTDEELRRLVLSTSKAILKVLPCLQLENDAIEEADSKYSRVLMLLEEDPEALSCQDQADKDLCGDCLEPCDVRDGGPEEGQ